MGIRRYDMLPICRSKTAARDVPLVVWMTFWVGNATMNAVAPSSPVAAYCNRRGWKFHTPWSVHAAKIEIRR